MASHKYKLHFFHIHENLLIFIVKITLDSNVVIIQIAAGLGKNRNGWKAFLECAMCNERSLYRQNISKMYCMPRCVMLTKHNVEKGKPIKFYSLVQEALALMKTKTKKQSTEREHNTIIN